MLFARKFAIADNVQHTITINIVNDKIISKFLNNFICLTPFHKIMSSCIYCFKAPLVTLNGTVYVCTANSGSLNICLTF